MWPQAKMCHDLYVTRLPQSARWLSSQPWYEPKIHSAVHSRRNVPCTVCNPSPTNTQIPKMQTFLQSLSPMMVIDALNPFENFRPHPHVRDCMSTIYLNTTSRNRIPSTPPTDQWHEIVSPHVGHYVNKIIIQIPIKSNITQKEFIM